MTVQQQTDTNAVIATPINTIATPINTANTNAFMSSIVISETCHYCRKGRTPAEIMHLPGGGKLCQECYRRHEQGVLAMSGLKANSDGTFSSVAPMPAECSECRLSSEELSLRAGTMELQMAVHFENGIYRMMCPACSKAYVPKRRDLYGATAYGYSQRLS